jgi:hypothetical protein
MNAERFMAIPLKCDKYACRACRPAANLPFVNDRNWP